MSTVFQNICNNLPHNPFFKNTDDKDNEHEISYDNNETPPKDMDQLNSSVPSRDCGKDNIILKINSEIEKARENYNYKLSEINNEDEKMISHLNIALREIFTNTQFMVKKIIKKGIIESADRTDLEGQYEYLKELNNICSNIYGKYRRKSRNNR